MASLTKYFSIRLPYSSPKPPQITPQQHATLTVCISQTRRNIHELMKWTKQCHCNLLTVGRAVNYQLFISPKPMTEDYERIRVAVEALIRNYTLESPAQSTLPLTPAQIAMEIKCPGSLIERSRNEEEKVPLPSTLDPANRERLMKQKENLNTVLQWLVLKQAEVNVEADELVAEFLFWAEILKF